MVINVDGEVTPCCYWAGYTNLGESMGNIQTKTLKQIWNGPSYQKLRRDIIEDTHNTPCHTCLARRIWDQGTLANHPYESQQFRPGSMSARNGAVNLREFKEKRTLLRSQPLIVSVSSTTVCNIHCTFCSQIPKLVDKLVLNDPAVQQITKIAPQLYDLAWLGGESLLDRRLRAFIDTADPEACAGLGLSLGSNGLLVNAALVEKLLAKFDRVSVVFSVDSFVKETYERIRYGAKYEKVIGNLRDLLALVRRNERLSVAVQAGLMKSTLPEVRQNLEVLAELGVEKIFLSPFTDWPPHEMLNCYTSFAEDTRGWLETIDDALGWVAGQIERKPSPAFDAAGRSLTVVRDLVVAMAGRYRETFRMRVEVVDVADTASAASWPVTDWRLFDRGLYGSNIWIDVDFANPVNLDYGLLYEGRPVPRYRTLEELVAAEPGEEGGCIFPNPTRCQDGRRFIGVIVARPGGAAPRIEGQPYRIGLVPRPPIRGQKQPKHPLVVVFDTLASTSAIGYARLDGPGTATIDLPADLRPDTLVCTLIEDELSYYAADCAAAAVRIDGNGAPSVTLAWVPEPRPPTGRPYQTG